MPTELVSSLTRDSGERCRFSTGWLMCFDADQAAHAEPVLVARFDNGAIAAFAFIVHHQRSTSGESGLAGACVSVMRSRVRS